MQVIIELIRKLVVLVLLMEVVLQLQSGKAYEPYIKMLIGVMVVYSLVNGLFQAWGSLEGGSLAPMEDFKWVENWYEAIGEAGQEHLEQQRTNIENIEPVQIHISPMEEIRVQPIQ